MQMTLEVDGDSKIRMDRFCDFVGVTFLLFD